MEIKSVKLRFDKWKHTTDKAHLLIYHGKEVWLSKKLAWDFQVAGNDLHAWATIPAWLFEKITSIKAEDAQAQYGTHGMKEYFGAIVHTVIEHHKPTPIAPVENNSIQELKK